MTVIFAGRIADEHMHLSVEKSTRRASVTSGSHQFLRAASARKRRKSLGSNSHTKETILFEVRHLSFVENLLYNDTTNSIGSLKLIATTAVSLSVSSYTLARKHNVL